MKQRIIIKNFGPIKDVDLEIDDFMVFIGPQASGKSTIAKLIYFFRSLRDEVISELLNLSLFRKNHDGFAENMRSSMVTSKMYNVMGFGNNTKGGLLKFFYSLDIWIEIDFGKNGKPYVLLSEDLSNKISEFATALINIKNTSLFNAKFSTYLSEYITEEANKIFTHKLGAFFVIAGREKVIDAISNNLEIDRFDFLTKDFIEKIRFIREKSNLFKGETISDRLNKNILKGKYNNEHVSEEGDGDRLYHGEDYYDYVYITEASSGQKEAVWLLNTITYFINNKENVSLTIEEPEAHLYPEAQRDMVNLIALLANSGENQVLITTHSPYILAAVNNLMFAHKVGQQKSEEVANRIDRNLWLDYRRVGAYYVGGEGNEGRIKKIMDDELHLIQNQYLDGVSQILNEEFDYLYELDEDVS